jgi:hypothetical protein|tara:strand:- start:634 stop:852 length:219 start_codon:yes stop_codon:yes gene_type:complete
MKQKEINIKEGTTGLISFYAKKYGKFITRTFLWDNKCTSTSKYVIYYDTFRKNYRCATRPVKMSINVNRKAG